MNEEWVNFVKNAHVSCGIFFFNIRARWKCNELWICETFREHYAKVITDTRHGKKICNSWLVSKEESRLVAEDVRRYFWFALVITNSSSVTLKNILVCNDNLWSVYLSNVPQNPQVTMTLSVPDGSTFKGWENIRPMCIWPTWTYLYKTIL